MSNITLFRTKSPFLIRGPLFTNKGASSAQKQLEQQQATFYQTLTQDYATQFAGQQAILSQLNSAFSPILAAGPNQTGFSPAEETALRTGASDNFSTSYQQAQKALNSQQAAKGGGNTFLPSGVTEQLNEQLAASGAAQNATTQNQITQENYAQGRANFAQAAAALTGNAQIENPTGYIGGANNAGENAFNSATKIQQENGSWLSTVGGILGGAASSFINPLGTAASGAFNSFFNNSGTSAPPVGSPSWNAFYNSGTPA